jgi:2-hydroxymuconate-semialdehyde hydrolase
VSENPEIGETIKTRLFDTNCHVVGDGAPVLLIHGSGPGVTAWANWRLVIPELARSFKVIAPDMAGFGYSKRPVDGRYSLDLWVDHALALLDALGVDKAHIVGNSYGGALAIALATRHPDRVERLVLMGSVGVDFELTAGLDAVWGYEPSIDNMRALLDIFAYNRNLVTDELAELRYQASIRPGVQEAFSAMFPAPRQRWVQALATPEDDIRDISQNTLIIHGRDDEVIPLQASIRLHSLILKSQLHVFGQCGHWTQIEHSQRFNRLVESFLSE